MKIPRIIIAGTNSGCGKTTITTGIMAALAKRGMNVQPFKVGPDYIDPMFHTYITGNASRNLDSWMLDEKVVRSLFIANSADKDIAVVEGVMGFFDGYGGYSQTGSTAHIAKIIDAPAIIVVNCEGMSLSAAALIKGFMDFEGGSAIKGVIINNIKSGHHYQLLKSIIEENTGLKVAGYLERLPELSLSSRHLGLVPSEEVEGLQQKLDLLSVHIEKTIDIDLLLKLGGQAVSFKEITVPSCKVNGKPEVRIAVARDRAFNFYYQDNLDLLKALGAELVPFSPINDRGLPDDIDGLYIGGGYPEVWAGELQKNLSMRENIKSAIVNGLPTYAECGGFMYLTRSIKTRDGLQFEMAGVIPGDCEMTDSLKRFGYVEIELLEDSIIGKRDSKIRAHEFHYSITNVDEGVPSCYRVVKKRRDKEGSSWDCGYKMYNMLAGYPHLHFWSNTGFAQKFVESCKSYKEQIAGSC